MINGMYHYEGDIYYKGKRIPDATIDACLIGDKYEIMCFKGGIEYAVETSKSVEDAEKAYNDMIDRFTKAPNKPIEKPLTGKYAKLRDDLIIAVEAGKKADHGEDGGTCNFDSPSLLLPRWQEKKVKQAAKEAGIGCFKWELFGGARYVFTTPTRAQGNRNCRVSEAMCKALETLGYSVLQYCSMD